MATSFVWKEKVCLVTGASGGIGLALVKSFLSRGAKCLMADVNYRVRMIFIRILRNFYTSDNSKKIETTMIF